MVEFFTNSRNYREYVSRETFILFIEGTLTPHSYYTHLKARVNKKFNKFT